jgi:hypothetical protein
MRAVCSLHVQQDHTRKKAIWASGLWLKADGTFENFLTVGSLDEAARGRRTATGSR